MILEGVLKRDCLEELTEAIQNNSDFEYQDDELSISLVHTGDSTHLEISHTNTHKEVKEFRDFLNELDDDLFIEVCENLNIQEVSNCLDSNCLETIMSGIYKFKNTLKKIIEEKIYYYNMFLDKCSLN